VDIPTATIGTANISAAIHGARAATARSTIKTPTGNRQTLPDGKVGSRTTTRRTMTYILTIQRRDENPKYDAQKAASARNFPGYQQSYDEPRFVETQVLLMEVSTEMFDSIRKAALEVGK
jgi:hypothetical protein